MWKNFSFILANFLLCFTPAFSSLGYNATCTVSPDNCDKYKGIKCDPDLQVCRCREDFPMEYNPDKASCVVKGHGSSCYDATTWTRLTCEDSLFCDRFDENDVYKENYTCYCQRNFIPYKNQTSENPNITICLPTRPGLPCSDSLPCLEGLGLICSRGRCACTSPRSQEFDGDRGGCLGFAEYPNGCNTEEKHRVNQCTENSFCGDDNKCHCKPDSSLDMSRFPRLYCKLNYGEMCDYECNNQRGLKCIDGVCGCAADAAIAYDPEQKLCALLEDYPCTTKPGFSLGQEPCFTGLKCQGNSTNPNFTKCVQSNDQDDNDDDKDGAGNEEKNCTSGKNEGSENNGNENVVMIFKMFK